MQADDHLFLSLTTEASLDYTASSGGTTSLAYSTNLPLPGSCRPQRFTHELLFFQMVLEAAKLPLQIYYLLHLLVQDHLQLLHIPV